MITVMITGANRGIGFELVKQYAGDGARVFACCRSPESAGALQSFAAKAGGGRVAIHPLDVTDPAEMIALKQQLGSTPIDILINNAGISDGHETGVDYEIWEKVFRVNSIAPYRVATTFRANLAASSEKKLATISSQLGSIAENTGGRTAYRSSKAAVNQVMKGLAVEYRAYGITVIILHPGWVRTDMGGPQAPVSAGDSARGLKRVIAAATLETTGKFIDYQGKELPW
jgi:NAD(P)-dependent dehydrogenase (short-subunit alcohol dehydrogenase family)